MTKYRTNSLQLAAFLATEKGVTFTGIEKDNPVSIAFLFEPKEKADEMTKEYFAGKSKVDALELFKNYRMLKDLLFDAKRNSQQE